MTVNENIRRIRLEKGLSQKEVAEACGTVPQTITAYESGRANPKPATVAKIAKALGVSAAEIYGMTENEQISAEHDPATAAAIYHSIFIENGGEIAEDNIIKRHLLTAYEKLNTEGRRELANRAEEMTMVSKFCLSPVTVATVVAALGKLTEKEQGEILSAYQVRENAKLELSLMEKQPGDHSGGIRNSEALIKESDDTILNIVLAVLGRYDIDKH